MPAPADASWTFPATSDGWCSSPGVAPASLQLTLQYDWAQEPNTTSIPVQLIVRTPLGVEQRQDRRLYGGGGRSPKTDISGHFNFTQAELCGIPGSQLCVQVRYAPSDRNDLQRVDQVWKRVCTAR